MNDDPGRGNRPRVMSIITLGRGSGGLAYYKESEGRANGPNGSVWIVRPHPSHTTRMTWKR